MGGVDIADQYNGYYQIQHRSISYFWRRVFEQKLAQAASNAWLLFVLWITETIKMIKDEIEVSEEAGHKAEDQTDEGSQLKALALELDDFKALKRKKRADWMRSLSKHLMSHSTQGCTARGGRRRRSSAVPIPKVERRQNRRPEPTGVASRHHCECPDCSGSPNPRPGVNKRPRGAKVSTACFCEPCASVGGVVICKVCYASEAKHEAAFNRASADNERGGARKRRKLDLKTR